ncbi:MAG TPA: monooxygenase, partial [Sporolactobacillaceae bacterium]|nr:monooxygenase [Sporolactobacillaceae bacterium]
GAGEDNFTPLNSLDWQVHVYGDAKPELKALCDERKLPLHIFPWTADTRRAGLQRSSVYLVRPDSYVGLADPEGTASAVASYLDTRKLLSVCLKD